MRINIKKSIGLLHSKENYLFFVLLKLKYYYLEYKNNY